MGTSHARVIKESAILVLYYAPWCSHCQSLLIIWDKIADLLSNNGEVKVGKFDATANEADGLMI